MIGFFNKLANSWIAKIICAVLGLSMMAFWGLGGISMTSGNDNTAIKIGHQKISMQKINQALENQRNKLGQMTGKYISQKQAVENGLLDQVIQQEISETLQNQLHGKIGLTASDKAVRKYVETNPVFQDNLGHFDTQLFYTYLGQLKMNQEELSEKLKTELAHQHLTNALLKSIPHNENLIKTAVQTQKEVRKISYFVLKQNDISVETPSEGSLREYYEAYQDEFTTPEYRKIYVASIMPSDFKIDKEEAYDKMYKSVQNLEDLLGAGTPLKEATQKLNLSQPIEFTIDISGKNMQGHIPDKKLQQNSLLQEVFVLNKQESTSIIDYENGFIVAEVEDIIPVSFKPYNTVKSDVLALYQKEQQKEKLPKITEQIIHLLSEEKTWGKYLAQEKSIQRNETGALFKHNIEQIFNQKKGKENARSYPLTEGTLFVVVNEIITDNTELKNEEKTIAIATLAQDWSEAFQKSYLDDYPVLVNQEAIKKNYSNLFKEE